MRRSTALPITAAYEVVVGDDAAKGRSRGGGRRGEGLLTFPHKSLIEILNLSQPAESASLSCRGDETLVCGDTQDILLMVSGCLLFSVDK